MIGTKVLHYEILKKLGEGGMGAVYLAEDTKLNRKVALKFLAGKIVSNDEEIERFRNEARIAASLSHPNIAQIYAMEDYEEGSFISMQYVEGENLKDYIEQENLSLQQKIKIVHGLLDGLLAAEEKGIIHRDIKASNIMIDKEGIVKVLDFGLARFESAPHLTSTGETRGTSLYMAPELILGEDATVKSDIWAFGIVLYQLFTQELPFDGVYEQAITYAILDEEPKPVEELNPEVPAEIKAVINHSLQKKPEERYSGFREIRQELNGGDADNKVNKKGYEPKGEQNKIYSKKRAVLASVALMCVALVITVLSLNVISAEGSGHKKVAVIPFKNVGEVAENRILLDGILETMTSKLSQVDNYRNNFWVIPSSEILNGDIKTPKEAYRQFRADLAVTGSLQNIDGSMRLTINLIDAENLRQINSRVMDISGDNILNLQAEMVFELMGMLDVKTDDDIKKTIEAGITKTPKASAYYVNGQGYLSRYQNENNIDNAIALFKQSVDEDPGYALAFAALGESFWRKFEVTKRTNFVDSALFYLDRAKKINPNLIPVKKASALILTGTGEYEEAIEIYFEILQKDPRNEEVYGALGNAYQQLDENEKAEEAFKKAVSLNPDSWLEYKRLGNFYMSILNYEKAVEAYRQVNKLAPDNPSGYTNLGVALLYMGNMEEALKMQKKSYELEPNFGAASNYATFLRISGNYEEALKYYSIATELSPDDYAGWGNLASFHGLMGNQEKERENYLKAIEVVESLLKVNPVSTELNILLGSYYADVGMNEKAREFIDKSLRLAPKDPEVLFRAGTAYERLGERTRGYELLVNAVEEGYSLELILNEPELKTLVEETNFKERINLPE